MATSKQLKTIKKLQALATELEKNKTIFQVTAIHDDFFTIQVFPLYTSEISEYYVFSKGTIKSSVEETLNVIKEDADYYEQQAIKRYQAVRAAREENQLSLLV